MPALSILNSGMLRGARLARREEAREAERERGRELFCISLYWSSLTYLLIKLSSFSTLGVSIVCVCMRACTFGCIYVCVCVCVHASVTECECVKLRMHVRMYTCICVDTRFNRHDVMTRKRKARTESDMLVIDCPMSADRHASTFVCYLLVWLLWLS